MQSTAVASVAAVALAGLLGLFAPSVSGASTVDVCDGVGCADLPSDVCVPGGNRVRLLGFQPGDPSTATKSTFIYELCSPFEGVCTGDGSTPCLDNDDCIGNGSCNRDCAEDSFDPAGELLIQVPSADEACVTNASTRTGGSCGCAPGSGASCDVDPNIIVVDENCPVGSEAAVCENVSLEPGDCVEMELKIPGVVDLGLGTANAAAACEEACLATPSCTGCNCDGDGAGFALCKQITDGPRADTVIDRVVEVGKTTTTSYEFTIIMLNEQGVPVRIRDTVPAEWECDPDLANCVDVSDGFVFVKKNGRKMRGATKVLWEPCAAEGGDPPRDQEDLCPTFGNANVSVSTRQSRGRGNSKFSPTSCGSLVLNDGAFAHELDPQTGRMVYRCGGGDPDGALCDPNWSATCGANPSECQKVTLAVSAGLCLAAVEDLNGGGVVPDGSGDEDGDGISDYEEACVLDRDPCTPGI
jgi:hypothetical protein